MSTFLAFDLLRIDVFGFQKFCEYFLSKFPGYFISPLRLSGSAVESLFSQCKYNANGKLDEAKYSSARASLLVQQTVSNHYSGAEYRDEKLSIQILPLKKKSYGGNTK
jgi:hypothetical protein